MLILTEKKTCVIDATNYIKLEKQNLFISFSVNGLINLLLLSRYPWIFQQP